MILLLLLVSVLDGEGCIEKGKLTMTNNTRKIEINISLKSGDNITILDSSKGLDCKSTTSCYAECSTGDFFDQKNFTETETSEVCVTEKNPEKTVIHLTIQSTGSICTVVDCLPGEINDLLQIKESQMVILKDLRNILNMKKMCRAVILNLSLVDTYIRVEKKALQMVINMTISEQSKTFYQEDLSMTVVKINSSMADGYLPIAVPNAFDYENVGEILMPVELFLNDNQTKIGVVTYNSYDHFKLKLENKMITSTVIRIEVPGHDTEKLAKEFKIMFNLTSANYSSNQSLSCEFYGETGEKTWITDGCSTNRTSDDVVECTCNHMTPFALLLVDLKISKRQWEVLSYISYVGCSLSAFFSAVTVFSFVFNSNARAEVSSSIHVSLSGALFVLNMSFMFSEWAATLSTKGACVFVAVTIHYSLLSSFTWMAIEAMHLYLLLIRVFNIYIRHYMIKLSLIGWGVPAVVVGALLSVHNIKQFYGSSELTLSDTNATNAVCWITEPLVLYGVTLSYFTIVFLFNLGILITVSRQIFRLRRVRTKYEKMPIWKDAGTVLGLMCLLGTTWGLAFFTAGYTIYPILYLFCIINSMQGFYIFVWMCGTATKNRMQSSNSKTKSTLDPSK